MRVSRLLSFCAVFVIALAQTSSAQNIIVTVDGDPVRFTGVGPRTIQGRVLVPLRGVLEKMGAFVGWDAANRTVIAERGDTSVQLVIGSRTASINGTQTTLDVPAIVYAGSTMVPLRFLGEALGADILWDSATRSVQISTDGSTPVVTNPTPTTGAVEITSFTHNASDWLKADDVLQVEMRATPGGTAVFQIPGVVSNVAMREISSGRYTGSWKVPAAGAKLSISGATVLGQLKLKGQERIIQAGSNISVDTEPPTIANPSPAPATVAGSERPGISATFDDKTGSGIDENQVSIWVNGVDRTSAATTTSNFVNYRPEDALNAGEYSVRVAVRDMAGNQSSSTWKFNVTTAGSVITSIDVSGDSEVVPGDVLTVTADAKAGSQVSFSIGNKVKNVAMTESPTGSYTGNYTIRRGDDLAGERVTVMLKTTSGNTFYMDAPEPVGGIAKAPDAPTIKSPAAGDTAKSPMTVTGTAPAGAKVRIKVDYTTQLLGLLGTQGVLADQQVEASAKGFYQSEPVNLSGFLKGKNTQYTVTVTSISAAGVESEPVSVTIEG